MAEGLAAEAAYPLLSPVESLLAVSRNLRVCAEGILIESRKRSEDIEIAIA